MLFPNVIFCHCCIYSFRTRTLFGSNLKLPLETILIGYVNPSINPQVFATRPHPVFVISAVHVSEFSLFVILDEARYCDLGGLSHFPALERMESLLASLK